MYGEYPNTSLVPFSGYSTPTIIQQRTELAALAQTNPSMAAKVAIILGHAKVRHEVARGTLVAAKSLADSLLGEVRERGVGQDGVKLKGSISATVPGSGFFFPERISVCFDVRISRG